MILTHCPFEPTPSSTDWNPESPGSKTYKGDPRYFGDMVNYMDQIVGRILKQLDDSGVRENTLVLFTGDNGTDTPIVSMMGDTQVAGAKGKTTDGGNHVPLIVQWKGKTAQGTVCNDIVDFSDFLPTMCDAANVKIPASPQLDGRSFLPQLMGNKGNPREWIYQWYARNGGAKGVEFARNQRYKLYRTGKFYDIATDRLEQNPLKLTEVDPATRLIHRKLKTALDQYSDARPRRFANWKQEKKKAKQKKKKKTAA
jgi:arylsulfatase A